MKQHFPIIFIFLFVISGWRNILSADCGTTEIKEIIFEKMTEMKKKKFFGFEGSGIINWENFEKRYYFISKKEDFGEEKIYIGLLVIDSRVCELVQFNNEELRPIDIEDFKGVGMDAEENCSLNRLKNVIYERLLPDLANGFHSYYGSIMKSWGSYEFVYTAILTDRTNSEKYLGRVEITRSSCIVKDELLSVLLDRPEKI